MGAVFQYKFLILVIVIILTTVGGGVIVFRQLAKTTPKPSQSTSQNSSGQYATPSGIDRNALIRSIGAPHIDPSQKIFIYNDAIGVAKYADTLEIKDCHQTPQVLKVDPGKNINFHNQDSTDHKIVIDGGPSFTLPANGSYTVTTNFSSGWGEYLYDCDANQVIGTIVVTKP